MGSDLYNIKSINVNSEIKSLKKVLLHRPGEEVENITPNTLERLLFDDIPYLKVMQQEHDIFAQTLKDNNVEVVYLHELMKEVLKDNTIKEQFIKQFLNEANINDNYIFDLAFHYINSI